MVTINPNNASTSTSYSTNDIPADQSRSIIDVSGDLEDEPDIEEIDIKTGERDELWNAGGTASDPEVEGGRERIDQTRKKRVRWKIDSQANEDFTSTSSAFPPIPRRRRTRSLSGEELFNFRQPSSWDSTNGMTRKQSMPPAEQSAPVVRLHLPSVEGGWQTKPFSPSSGIPTIIKRPTIDDLSKNASTSTNETLLTEPILADVITASPQALPARLIEEIVTPSNSNPELSSSVHSIIDSPLTRRAKIDALPEETPTAPSSPLFPPLPTPAPSSSLIMTMPKFTPPLNLVQSPRITMARTISKDRSSTSEFTSSPRVSPNTELYKQTQDVMFKSALSPVSRLSRPLITSHHVQQSRPNNRRQLLPTPSTSINIHNVNHTTQPSPPNPVSLTTSPRSPTGHSLSPHTPQSTIISPAPLPSISIIEDQDFAVPHRPDSPPWQTVGPGVTSPRMKQASWRAEVLSTSAANLIKSPPVTPFTSVHLQIDELPNETDSDHESLRPPIPSPLPAAPLTPLSVADEPSPRPAILSPSPPKLLDLVPSTPPFKSDDNMDQDEMEEILQRALVPWLSKGKEASGVLPVRKVVKRTERGEWEDGMKVDDIPRESAHWKLVQAQRLWLKGNQEFFKLKHPSGLPRDHKTPKIQYVEGGEALRAVEIIVQSILLDARVVAFKSPDARKDFMEQLAWQFYADARHTGWPDLVNIDYDLDEMFAKAELRAQGRGQFVQGGVISTRRSLASFIRNHVILATLEEEEGLTQAAVIRYGRALDIIDWVNQTLGPTPDKVLYGKGDAKQRIEVVFEGVFGRGVQIRLGLTLISQYNYIKRNPNCSTLRIQMLEELLAGARNLFESFEVSPMSPYVKKDLTLDVYISDYVYHVAYALFFKGFYGKENAKLLLDMDQPSPVGGTPAVEIARRRSKSSAQALAQAALLFPEDEEERIQCFELALEEILKVGGLRVGEARAMYRSLKEAKVDTDRLWNHPANDEDDDAEDATSGLFDDETAAAKKKKKKNKKKAKKEAAEGADAVAPAKTPKELATPKQSSPSALLSPQAQTPRLPASPPSKISPHSLLLESWFTALQRNQDEKRIMSGDVLHPAHNLRGRPEVVWVEAVEDGDDMDDESSAGSIPWASWGMKSVKATKWEDLIKEEAGSKKQWSTAGKGRRTAKTTKHATSSKMEKVPEEIKKLDPVMAKIDSSPTRVPDTIKATPRSSPTKLSKISPINESPTKTTSLTSYTAFDAAFPMDSIKRNSIDLINSVLAEVDAANSPKSMESPLREPKPAARQWDRPTPWGVIARISKEKFFSLDLDAFDGNDVKK